MLEPDNGTPDFDGLSEEIKVFSDLFEELRLKFQSAKQTVESLRYDYNYGLLESNFNNGIHTSDNRQLFQNLIDYKFDSCSDFWIKPINTKSIPYPFISKSERKRRKVNTRFISFINFKGGVGKTTLTSNLTAAFANGRYSTTSKKKLTALRVLVVDLDFQGTLSDRCVESVSTLNKKLREQKTSTQLLVNRESSIFTMDDLAIPFVETDDAKIVPCDHLLDSTDNRFFFYQVFDVFETRFNYRSWFHQDYIFDNFDLVIFDCPPRKSASSINALTSSDYVFLPMGAEEFDKNGFTRTLEWLVHLIYNLHLSLEIGGVILNRTYSKDSLSARENNFKLEIFDIINGAFNSNYKEYQTYENKHDRPSVLSSFIPRRSGSNSLNGTRGDSLNGAQVYGNYFSDLTTEIFGRIYQ